MHRIDAAYCYICRTFRVVCMCVCICMFHTQVNYANTDKPNVSRFGGQTRVDPRNSVLDGGPYPHGTGHFLVVMRQTVVTYLWMSGCAQRCGLLLNYLGHLLLLLLLFLLLLQKKKIHQRQHKCQLFVMERTVWALYPAKLNKPTIRRRITDWDVQRPCGQQVNLVIRHRH